jgi:hypothetical protein
VDHDARSHLPVTMRVAVGVVVALSSRFMTHGPLQILAAFRTSGGTMLTGRCFGAGSFYDAFEMHAELFAVWPTMPQAHGGRDLEVGVKGEGVASAQHSSAHVASGPLDNLPTL